MEKKLLQNLIINIPWSIFGRKTMTSSAIVDALRVIKTGRIVDLTHLVHPGIQRFGAFPAMTSETRYTVAESGFHVEQVSFVTQYGTHIDAPEHFVEGRRTLEAIELDELMLPLFVLHFEDKVAADPEFIVHADDVKAWEAEHGPIAPESFVAFSSGWHRRMSGGDMNNRDAEGVAHCPGWGLDALEYLFETRGVTAVGHETLDTDGSADVRAKGFLYGEKYVLEHDHYQIEVMANLDQVPSTGAVIFVGVPKFDRLPGFPVRAWAVVPAEA